MTEHFMERSAVSGFVCAQFSMILSGYWAAAGQYLPLKNSATYTD
jgi:hypothetical protein